MTYKSPNPNQRVNTKAIAWALFSQSIWLPVLLTDTQDQIANKSTDYDFSGVAANIPQQNLPPLDSLKSSAFQNSNALVARAQQASETSGVVLNATLPKESTILSKLHSTTTPLSSTSSPIALSPSVRPSTFPDSFNFTPSESVVKPENRLARSRDTQPSDLLRKLYSRSDLLGGSLTLGDLNEPLMPPIARAERAQSTRSGDPLSTIPQMWREPMRKALKNLSDTIKPATSSLSGKTTAITVEQARVIHVPSSKVKRFSEVPLALQSDGTVDILNSPDDPEVVEEIKTWSTKQKLPAQGRMAPAVVHLHPIPQQEQAPVSEKVTQASPQRVQPTDEPAPVSLPVVQQEASLPDALPPSPPAPTPPPPIIEAHTSSLQPLEAVSTVAEVPSDISVPVSNGEGR